MNLDGLLPRLRWLLAAGERRQYKTIVKALPQLIEDRRFDEIERILVSCGSFQVASNFKDMVDVFQTNGDSFSKIVEIGTFNFASSTLINSLKPKKASFYGFDNWDLGGTGARLTAEWRSRCFPNCRVVSGHPLSSSMEIKDLYDTELLVIDGNHSFRATLADCGCFDVLKDGATVFFHDCGLGNRVWGCFWVYYLLYKYGVVKPLDNRFDGWIRDVDSRRKPAVNPGEKPEIEFAIGRFNKNNYADCRHLLSDPALLWEEVRIRFAMRSGLDMTAQSYLWKEWFG